MWGDVLENLKPSDLRITPGLATLRRGVGSADHIMLSQGAPSNQQNSRRDKKVLRTTPGSR